MKFVHDIFIANRFCCFRTTPCWLFLHSVDLSNNFQQYVCMFVVSKVKLECMKSGASEVSLRLRLPV